MKVRILFPLIALSVLWADWVSAAPLPPGYHAKVTVAAATRIDWTFALANRSLVNPPADWLGDYGSTAQQYELFVPRRQSKKLLPVIRW